MRSEKQVLAFIIAALFVLTILAVTAFAVPKTINYQGRLADSGGVPVNTTVSMTFAIYNAPIGGTALWTETQPSVAVTDGTFSVALGNLTPISLPFDEQYYLGVNVNGDGEMEPRAVLVSVPYAMRAGKAETLGDKTLSELIAMLDGRYRFRSNLTTVDSGGDVGQYSSIAIGSDNLPVISYYDNTNKDLKVAHCGDASCTTGNRITTVDYVGDVGQYSSIAIGADDLPIISYYNATSADLQILHCGDIDCSTGNTITIVDSAGDVGQYTSIAIGVDDLPVISYYNATSADLMVAHCGDAACSTDNTISTVDSTGDVGKYTSIAIGIDNLPIISYCDMTNSYLMALHCGDTFCSSGNIITTLQGGANSSTSIAIGTDGLPWVVSTDTSEFGGGIIAQCGDISCTWDLYQMLALAERVDSYPSIAIGADNLPLMSYYDMGLKALHHDYANSIVSTVDPANNVGYYTSIVIGADDLPVISYYDATNGDLKVAKCGDVTCALW